MIKTKVLPFMIWALFGLYIFFAYHLLLIPFVLEYSLIGMLISWGALLAIFFIIPKKHRKLVATYILLIVFATKALQHVGMLVNFTRFFYLLVVVGAIFAIGKLYFKLSKTILLSLLVVSLAIHFTVPRDQIRLYTHFTEIWDSPILYLDNTVDYFPLFVRDIDEDGQFEIITFGHRDEQMDLYYERKKKGLDPDRMPYDIQKEPLFLYVFKWNGTEMERVDNDTIDLEQLRPYIPKDYIGFPYYVLDENFTLVPQMQKQPFAEKMGQFGAAPFHVMDLNMQTLSDYLKTFDGVYDKKDHFRFETNIEEITIKNGSLIIKGAQGETSFPTRATKIVDLIQTEDGVGLLLLSDQLELWSIDEKQNIALTHTLTENQISNIMSSEYIAADIKNDGIDEILISSETSRIIRPTSNSNWEILFTSPDKSLRFEDYNSIGKDEHPSIIALSKSQVRNHPLRFLTGFTYTDQGLKQDWKVFTSLINVKSVDITGNGQNELVATIWGTHKVYIFEKHNFPVSASLFSIFLILVGYAGYRRVRYNG